MKSHVRYSKGVQFEAESRGHRVRTDLEAMSGGWDSAMSPPEMLLASLGTCAGFYALQYLNAHKIPAGELEVEVVAEKAKEPARLGTFRIEVRGCGDANVDGVRRAVEKCLIHNTLMHPPKIEVLVGQPVGSQPS